MHLNNHPNKKLKNFARELRVESETRAERRIWKTLLSKRQTGERFLRQQAIEDCVVVFFCPDLNLVVEIEGIKSFTKPNYNVVTFSEDEVINRLEDVSVKMQSLISAIKSQNPAMHNS